MGKSLKTYVILLLTLTFIIIDVTTIESLDEKSKLLPPLNELQKEEAIENLQNDIDKALSSSKFRRSKISVAVYSIDENRYYYKKNITEPLTPASATKLFTTFTALYAMGEDFHLKTSVFYTGEIKDSTLFGDLYLYGRGDGLLSSNDIDSLSAMIYEKGVRVIKGEVYGDGSYFDRITDRKEYSGDRDRVSPLPPITALSVEKNTAKLIVSTKGTDLEVKTKPPSDAFKIVNSARRRGGSRGYNVAPVDTRKDKRYKIHNRRGDALCLNSPRRRGVRTYSEAMKDGKQKFVVYGRMYSNREYTYEFFIKNPALAAAGALKYLLEEKGVRVEGEYGEKSLEDRARKESTVIAEVSKPLREIVYQTNKNSDNYLAETLFKTIGAWGGGSGDNASRTRKIETMTAQKAEIYFKGCKLNDGSGLSRRNKLTAKSLISLLKKNIYLPFGGFVISSLSIAGYDGTLGDRMINSIAFYNVRAKTGTLRNVSALAGYVKTMDGETLAFAFLFNGKYVYDYKLKEDELATLLAVFSAY